MTGNEIIYPFNLLEWGEGQLHFEKIASGGSYGKRASVTDA